MFQINVKLLIAEACWLLGYISPIIVFVATVIGEKTPCKNRKINAQVKFFDKPKSIDKNEVINIPVIITGFLPHLSQNIPQTGEDIKRPIIIDPANKPTQYPVSVRFSTRPKYIIILLPIGKTTVKIKELVNNDK